MECAMTFRVMLGIDPGQTGAIAIVCDGEPSGFIDMPLMDRKTVGQEINTAKLASDLREVRRNYPDAKFMAIVEDVHSMPKMSISAMFKFGESFGALKGVLGALGIGYRLVQPQKWKKHFGLIRNGETPEAKRAYKDQSRTLAIQRYPNASEHLARKKDGGRADALLMAIWAQETEQAAAA